VNFDLARDIAGAADQPVRRRALVFDREKAARNLRATGRRAAPMDAWWPISDFLSAID